MHLRNSILTRSVTRQLMGCFDICQLLVVFILTGLFSHLVHPTELSVFNVNIDNGLVGLCCPDGVHVELGHGWFERVKLVILHYR